jgi:hypothetical protein
MSRLVDNIYNGLISYRAILVCEKNYGRMECEEIHNQVKFRFMDWSPESNIKYNFWNDCADRYAKKPDRGACVIKTNN